MDSACLAWLFLPPALLPGLLSPPASAFYLPLWWRGDIDDGFPAADRRSPSVFRFSVSTGRFCSVMLCLPLTNHPVTAKDTTPVTAPDAQHSQMTGIERREKIPGPERGNDFPAQDTRPTVSTVITSRLQPPHHW